MTLDAHRIAMSEAARPAVNSAWSGAGPGVQAPDGCSVELYRRLPYAGEIDLLRPLLRRRSSVLELGCGAGRITRALLGLNLKVTAVDNSPEMLASLPSEAVTVRADIESLRLPSRFDTVLLASCLINHPSPEVRGALLQTSRRHMKPSGQLFVECQDCEWLSNVRPGLASRRDGLAIGVDAVARVDQTIEMTLRYELGGCTWLHSFSAVALNERAIHDLLAENGLAPVAWNESQGRWVRAVLQPKRHV